MNLIYKVLGLEDFLENFRQNTKKSGFNKASVEFIKSLGIKIEFSGDIPPQKGPLLIISRHLTGLDPYVIAGIIKRDDLYFLADIYQTNKGKEISAHMIPIFYWDKMGFLKRPLISWPGYFAMRLKTGYMNKNEAKKCNEKAILKAQHMLGKGKAILIFPSGGDNEKRSWKPGLGEIINLTRRQKLKPQIYEVFITGLTEFSLLRYFVFRIIGFKEKKIKITCKRYKFDIFKLPKKEAYVVSQMFKSAYYKEFNR